MLIERKIRKISSLKSFDGKDLFIFVPYLGNENKLNLKAIGDALIPSPQNGKWCSKNAIGYTKTDKSSPKKNRYVTTIYIHPWGNTDLPLKPADIYKDCYQKIIIEPTEIYIALVSNEEGELFYATKLEKDCSDETKVTAINIFVEIFGYCNYSNELTVNIPSKIIKLDWEILPPGSKPSDFIRSIGPTMSEGKISYSEDRLKHLEKKPVVYIGQGINGSFGYFAFVFNKICIFESAFYGNATYIVSSKEWEELSKMTKKELIDSNNVLEKIIHNQNWFKRIDEIYLKFEDNTLKQEK